MVMIMRTSRQTLGETYIALLRGINIGGRHMVPMKELRALVEGHGCADVRTYIQSGNVVFRSTAADTGKLARQLSSAIARSYGFEPQVLVLTSSQLERAVAGNPFPEAASDPARLHLFFLTGAPKEPDVVAMNELKARTERFELKGRVFYLHTPEGFGRSNLAGGIERFLGVSSTARNWRTVTTLLEMAKSDP